MAEFPSEPVDHLDHLGRTPIPKSFRPRFVAVPNLGTTLRYRDGSRYWQWDGHFDSLDCAVDCVDNRRPR